MFLAHLSGDRGHHGVLAHLPQGPVFLKALPVQIFFGRDLGIWEGLGGLSRGVDILQLRDAVPWTGHRTGAKPEGQGVGPCLLSTSRRAWGLRRNIFLLKERNKAVA